MDAFLPLLESANTASCPIIFSVSITVTSANSLLLVREIAVGSLLAGNVNVGFVPPAVTVPAGAMKPDENKIIPELDQLPCPRASANGTPILSPIWFVQTDDVGSGRNPPHHGGSGFSVKQLFDHSIIVTRSMPMPSFGDFVFGSITSL